MGVAGLWDVLRPAAVVRSLSELAINEGFVANPDGVRGFRVGIDASIWFFHAEYGREGESPELRTLFFRCATLMHAPFLPVFVFDGPRRPEVKRGKKINRHSHKLVHSMKAMIEAFGFEWRHAPAEAEAELAYLNRIGVIDAVQTDDVDTFLFGATTVIRNPSNNLSGNRSNPALSSEGRDDKNHTWVFRMNDITSHPDIELTRGGMILIGLLKGGDYEQGGVPKCGPTIAHGLARCGFGDSLLQATQEMTTEELKQFLVVWREDLCHELRTNSQKKIGRKCVAVANNVPVDFPNMDILLSYTNPITSESEGKPCKKFDLTWSKEPNIGKLAETCELHFEWGYREAIIKRFRTVVWHGAVLRILRRAVLDLDQKAKAAGGIPSTPRKAGKNGPRPFGTPSKLITKHFSSLTVPQSGDDSDDDDDGERLIVKIHSQRKHAFTDGTLEYRLEIAPAQLVRIAESGIRGLRTAIGPDEWAEEEEDENGKKTKKPPPEPTSHMRVWMPACMVSIAEPHILQEYEEVQRKKEEKKANKGKGRGKGKAKKDAAAVQEEEEYSSSKEATPVKKKAPRKATATTNQPTAVVRAASLDLSDDDTLPPLPPAPVIRDLTKKKTTSSHKAGPGLKSFFPTQKPTANTSKKVPTQPSTAVKASTAIEIPDSPFAANYPEFLMGSSRDKSESNGSSRPNVFIRDLTKKKSSGIKASALSSQSIFPDEDSIFSTHASSSRPTSGQGKKPTTAKYSTDFHETDSFLFDSDEPGNSPLRNPPPAKASQATRKHVRNRTVTPSTSQESLGAHISKSPKKSPEHTSPRRGPAPSFGSRVRSTSPTRGSTRPAPSNSIINLSDSESEPESDDEVPALGSIAFAAPLLRARARNQNNSAGARERSKKQVAGSTSSHKPPPVLDIIDLT